jgi:hypothetical protein
MSPLNILRNPFPLLLSNESAVKAIEIGFQSALPPSLRQIKLNGLFGWVAQFWPNNGSKIII